MSTTYLVLLGVAVAISAGFYDFAVVRWNAAIRAAEDPEDAIAFSAARRAGRWAVAVYAIGLVGLLGVLKISIWLAGPEAVGFYYGSKIGSLWRRKSTS